MTQGRPPDLELLATCGWLAETPRSFREAVLDRCLVKRYRRGEAVYRAGDPPGGLFGLIRGGVGIEVSPTDREPYMATFARPGFWIGEESVLMRAPRYIGIRARQDSLLAHLPLAQWDRIVQADPEAWRWFACLSLRNALLAVAVADALMTPGAAGRVAAILLVLATHGPAPGLLDPVEIAVSQDDLARMANLSRSSTGRILQVLAARGLIESEYRRIRILDPDGLQTVNGADLMRGRAAAAPDPGTAGL